MLKKLALLIPTCMILAMVVFAAGGGASDPLVSLSYLLDSFKKELMETVDEKLDESDEELLERIETEGTPVQTTSEWAETRLKQGDILLGTTGTNALLLAGNGQIVFDTGAVIDVTTGEEVTSGSNMAVNHRYMVAEDTAAVFLTTSRTAVLDYMGSYQFAYAEDTVDYNAMAAALKKLNLFRGSFTGYGQGFDLELVPTRLQALIMFIRVLGEEEEALAWSGTTLFTDISKGSDAEKYVGYAYEKGYTNGYTATQFKPGNAVNAYQYTEFVLRAMGYSSVANTNLADTLIRAEKAGLLTSGEVARLQVEKFLRADLVYISYYALDTELAESRQTLAEKLMDRDVFTKRMWRDAEELVTSRRIK